MASGWQKIKDSWLSATTLTTKTSTWAIESIQQSEEAIIQLENLIEANRTEGKKKEQIEESLKAIRRAIKKEISLKENSLDGISLNSPNSSKLQISVPSNLNYLMKAWAAAEGRDLSSVALQCLETGLRLMKSKGSIPSAAVKRYDIACEKRIALSEANNVWDQHEEINLKNSI